MACSCLQKGLLEFQASFLMTLCVHEWELSALFWQVILLCYQLSDPCSQLATAPGKTGIVVNEQGGHVGASLNDRNELGSKFQVQLRL